MGEGENTGWKLHTGVHIYFVLPGTVKYFCLSWNQLMFLFLYVMFTKEMCMNKEVLSFGFYNVQFHVDYLCIISYHTSYCLYVKEMYMNKEVLSFGFYKAELHVDLGVFLLPYIFLSLCSNQSG